MKQNKFSLWQEVYNLEQAKKHIDNAIQGKKEYLRKLQQWWFSDDLFMLKKVQEYVNEFSGNCLWWLWQERSTSIDKKLEEIRPLSKSELAIFVCSKLYKNFQLDNWKFFINKENFEWSLKYFKENF